MRKRAGGSQAKASQEGQGTVSHRSQAWVYSLGVAVWGSRSLAEMPVHFSALARTWGRQGWGRQLLSTHAAYKEPLSRAQAACNGGVG